MTENDTAEQAARTFSDREMFNIKPLDDLSLSQATVALEGAFVGTSGSLSGAILNLTRTVNSQQAQIKSLQEAFRTQMKDLRADLCNQMKELELESQREKQRVANLEVSLANARSQIKVLEYNLSGYDPDDIELPPSALPHHRVQEPDLPPSSSVAQSVTIDKISEIPALESDVCLYLGGLDANMSPADLKSELDCPGILRIEVFAAEASSYALLFFGNLGAMETARGRVNEFASGSNAFLREISKSLQGNWWLLLTNLDGLNAGEKLQSMLENEFAKYNIEGVSVNFGATTRSSSVALLDFEEPRCALQMLSDVHSPDMAMDLSAVNAYLLNEEDKEELLKFKKKLRQNRSESAAMVSGMLPSATEDDLRELFSFAESVQFARSRSGASLGLAEVTFKEPLSKSNMADISSLSLHGAPISVEPLVSSNQDAPKNARIMIVDPEKKRRVVRALKMHADMLVAVNKLRAESLSKYKVKDPKMTMLNRLQDLETVMDKWFGKSGGIFEKMQHDIVRAEETLSGQRTTIESIRDISDVAFSDAFTERADEMISAATGAATEDAVVRAVRVVANSGIIEESPHGGWLVNEACITAVMKPSIDSAVERMSKLEKGIIHVERALPTKLDGPALRVLVQLLHGGAEDLDHLLRERGEGSAEQLFPFDFYLSLLNADNPMHMLTKPLHDRFDALNGTKADKIEVDGALLLLREEKQDKAAALTIKNQIDNELADLGQRCTKFNDSIETMETSLKTVERRADRELGLKIPGRFDNAERAIAEVRKLVEEHGKRGDSWSDELKAISSKLSERLTEGQVRALVKELELSLKARDKNDSKIEDVVEVLRLELETKMSRDEVMRIVMARLKDAEEKNSENSPADNMWTLKAAGIPDTIAIGKVKYKVFRNGLHNYPTTAATHKRMSPISATQAMPTPLQLIHQESLMSMTSTNTVSIASHSNNGRGGALKSLMGRTPPLSAMQGNHSSEQQQHRPSTTSSASRRG
jgi:hypothetical protein